MPCFALRSFARRSAEKSRVDASGCDSENAFAPGFVDLAGLRRPVCKPASRISTAASMGPYRKPMAS